MQLVAAVQGELEVFCVDVADHRVEPVRVVSQPGEQRLADRTPGLWERAHARSLPKLSARHQGVTGSGSAVRPPGSAVFVSATSNHHVIQRLGLTEHQYDRVKVLEVTGELDLWTAPTLCERIEQCLDEPLLVDLTQMSFCDSTGLRAIHGAAQEARIRCARLVLLAPQHDGAAHAFRLAGAAEFLPLAADLNAALAHLQH